MAVYKLLSLRAKTHKLLLAANGLLLAVADKLVELLYQARFQFCDALLIELNVRFVVVRDELLDAISRQVRHVAVLFAMATHADEVVVVAAHPFASREQEGPAAKAADSDALQIVVMGVRADFRDATSGQDLLDSIKDFFRDELRVVA